MHCHHSLHFKRSVEWAHTCISRFRFCPFIINNKSETVNSEHDTIIHFVYADAKSREEKQI